MVDVIINTNCLASKAERQLFKGSIEPAELISEPVCLLTQLSATPVGYDLSSGIVSRCAHYSATGMSSRAAHIQ